MAMGGNGPWRGGGSSAAGRSSSWLSSINNEINPPRQRHEPTNTSLPKLPSSYPTYSPSLSSVSAEFANNNIMAKSVEIIPSFVAGTFAFYSTLAMSTLLQNKVFRISTGTLPPIPTMAGLASVAAGGLVAHGSSVVMTSLQIQSNIGSTRHVPWRQKSSIGIAAPDINIDQAVHRLQSGVQYMRRDLNNLVDTFTGNPVHALRIATLALVTFKLLGGRFWAVSPSSYTNLGSFARASRSIPARMGYANPSQRKIIEAAGRKWGCHTCGSRMVLSRTRDGVRFHADHMPPRSVADRLNSRLWRRMLRIKVKQRFYPQCVDCSSVQGSILSKAATNGGSKIGARRLAASGSGSAAYNHGARPRMYHLAGGIIAAATVWDADEQQVVTNGNAKRFANAQNMFHNTVGAYAAEIW
eukprot:CAMPEP_0178522794 /NCGR_PEP_ID=MMETSP0696-20121128/28737_1 /TAXON_ID=265572 /ORGANISM="Extubocellulus spinifer, Strain CCMP396" /LENGTH=411 /DNA_ID=CAMNT_0020153961 /DNA_START=37 /DNA_END=1269 /DNA_ORIENTATION=+